MTGSSACADDDGLPSTAHAPLIAETEIGETGPLRGVAWFTHKDPAHAPPELFAGTNTLHAGGAHGSYLLLPVLPAENR